jgi:hypothetical protein
MRASWRFPEPAKMAAQTYGSETWLGALKNS